MLSRGLGLQPERARWDYSWPHTNPKHQRGRRHGSPSLTLFEVALLQFRPNGAALFQPRASDQRERRPGLENNMKSQALKGRHQVDDRCRVAPSGLQYPRNSPTQGVALGWHIDAPLGLELQKRNFKNYASSYITGGFAALGHSLCVLLLRVGRMGYSSWCCPR